MNSATPFADLTAIGFEFAGLWKLDGEGLICELNALGAIRNVLYAFVVDGHLVYVGKTVQPLRSRMSGYKSPVATQSTNIRNNRNLRECLIGKRRVEVFVFRDNGLLHYGKFHVNLAAGLEDSVIRELNPPWNGGLKENSDQSLVPTEA